MEYLTSDNGEMMGYSTDSDGGYGYWATEERTSSRAQCGYCATVYVEPAIGAIRCPACGGPPERAGPPRFAY